VAAIRKFDLEEPSAPRPKKPKAPKARFRPGEWRGLPAVEDTSDGSRWWKNEDGEWQGPLGAGYREEMVLTAPVDGQPVEHPAWLDRPGATPPMTEEQVRVIEAMNSNFEVRGADAWPGARESGAFAMFPGATGPGWAAASGVTGAGPPPRGHVEPTRMWPRGGMQGPVGPTGVQGPVGARPEWDGVPRVVYTPRDIPAHWWRSEAIARALETARRGVEAGALAGGTLDARIEEARRVDAHMSSRPSFWQRVAGGPARRRAQATHEQYIAQILDGSIAIGS
jgi:hypothetical protein